MILEDPALLTDLESLPEPVTMGDPTARLLYTSRSVRKLTKETNKFGHDISHTAACRILKDMDYRLQANKKTSEGSDHIDRDAQFEYINKQAKSFIRAKQPVISVDTKRKNWWAIFATTAANGVPRVARKKLTFTTLSIPS